MKLNFLILLLFFGSCKVTVKNAYGNFVLKNSRNSFFDLDTSGHFTFTESNPIKALLKVNNYFYTEGDWKLNDRREIVLQSLKTKKEENKLQKVTKANISSFTFFNIFGDSLQIVSYSINGQWFGSIHGLPKSFELQLSKGDSIAAYITGYDKFKFVSLDTSQLKFEIVLYPDFVPDYFKGKKLILKRNKLIDSENHKIFKKKKK